MHNLWWNKLQVLFDWLVKIKCKWYLIDVSCMMSKVEKNISLTTDHYFGSPQMTWWCVKRTRITHRKNYNMKKLNPGIPWLTMEWNFIRLGALLHRLATLCISITTREDMVDYTHWLEPTDTGTGTGNKWVKWNCAKAFTLHLKSDRGRDLLFPLF